MAQSVSKTFTMGEIGMSGSADVDFIRAVQEDGVWKYYHGITNINYNGSNNGAFDISSIPNGSVINSVKFTSSTTKNSNASFWGSSFSKYLNVSGNPELTDANILNYLRGQSTFTTVPCKFSLTTRTSAASGIYRVSDYEWDSGDGTITLYGKYTNLKLVINYTPPDEATVSYGTGNVWKMCNVCMAVNNAWKKVKVFFGTGGSWKQVK